MEKKKKRIPVLFIVVLVIMAAMLVVCSCRKADSSKGSAELKTEKTEERYEIIAMISEGKESTAEDLALLKSKGLSCTIVLRPDGTGVLDLFGEKTNLTWDEKNISAGTKIMPYTRKDDQLTLTDGNSSLTFLNTDESGGAK
ncbi:MAG: hypothetical protein IKG39_12280 [Lachnospiraceae bacterium]|nr:hypothetical protein [Lachnospiraceae bacterium]